MSEYRISKYLVFIALIVLWFSSCQLRSQSVNFAKNNLYPWCIVAYDSCNRAPEARIQMIKELGFVNYAYDWRERHLSSTLNELKLAEKNGVKVQSVWLWLNAKNDSLANLSSANEELISIVEKSGIKTTFWLSFNANFFKELSQQESLDKAKKYVNFIVEQAEKIDCKVALYNHSGWFGDPYNIIDVIDALPDKNLSMVFSFHHAFETMDEFKPVAKDIAPYLSAVNLNGMKHDGSKILTIGKGDYEKAMVRELVSNGFNGPWGIMGHVEGADVKTVLEENLTGLKRLE